MTTGCPARPFGAMFLSHETDQERQNMKILKSPIQLRQYALIAALGSAFLCGCAGRSDVSSIQYPSSMTGWHGMDAVDFYQPLRLQNYSLLVLEPFDTSTTLLPPQDDNAYEPARIVEKNIDGTFSAEMESALKGRLEVSSQKSEAIPPEKTLILRGKVVEVHPGSRAERYWVGFGAGHAWVEVSGEFVDAKSNSVLLKFDQKRLASGGQYGGEYLPMLTECSVEIAQDVGEMLQLFAPDAK
jgi:hypothetical protein